MIYNALNYVSQQLNEYLMLQFSAQDKRAILGSIVDETGAVPIENHNKIILSLVNIEHETVRQYAVAQQYVGDKHISQNLPYDFNLDVLVTSLFTNYNESLKFLSEAIYFFQAKHVFTHENSPGLDPRLQKLTFELIKINYSEMHNLWTALGSKYLPSVLFKVRMLSFQSGDINKVSPTMKKIDKNVNPSL